MYVGLVPVYVNFEFANPPGVTYQKVRVLVTPLAAVIDMLINKKSMPLRAAYMLFPVCLGMEVLSFYEAAPLEGISMTRTSSLGLFFAFTGVLASSIYTVWIKVFHDRLQWNSMQLLLGIVPSWIILLLYSVPFVDTFPVWSEVIGGKRAIILMASPCWISVIDL